jgi:hypothetical protein
MFATISNDFDFNGHTSNKVINNDGNFGLPFAQSIP